MGGFFYNSNRGDLVEVINNINSLLGDDLKQSLQPRSKVSIAASCFSIYAYEALKEELNQVEEVRFIFTSPTFVTDNIKKEKREFYIPKRNREQSLYGTEFEICLKNEMTLKAIAKECSEWIRKKVTFKSNRTTGTMQGMLNLQTAEDAITYMPVDGFTTVDLGYEKGNALSKMVNKFTEVPFTKMYFDLFEQVWNDKNMLEDVTQKVEEHISTVYKENAPEFIYYVILYNLFHEVLSDMTKDSLPNEATGFKESEIWKRLYNFQKDAVLGAINKL